MFKVATLLALMAVLQVASANTAPILLDIGKNYDAAKEVVGSYYEETGHNPALGTRLERGFVASDEAGDNSTAKVLTLPYIFLLYLGGVSLSLTEIRIEGLDLVEIPAIPDLLPNKDGIITIPIVAPSLILNSDHYIAGGKTLNLPFVGESAAQIGLTALNISLSYEIKSVINLCPKANSTVFEMGLDKLSMNFEDLNPGQDSGDLINAMLNSVTEDITKWLNLLLNEESGKELLEWLIGTVLPFNCKSGDELTAGLEETAGDKHYMAPQAYLAEFNRVFQATVFSLGEQMKILKEVTTFVDLAEELVSEIDLGYNADLI